jgi:MGT family glycosyltransferase
MMRIGFLAFSVPGHMNPMTTLARKLAARGHDVVIIGTLDGGPFAEAAKLPFIPYCEEEYPLGSTHENMSKLGKLKGEEALAYSIQSISEDLTAAFRHLPRILREARVDALVLDQVKNGLGFVPMSLDMPYAHTSYALHLDYSGQTPFCVFDWPYENTAESKAKYQAALKGLMQALEPISSVGRAYVEKTGMKIDWTDPWVSHSKLLWLTQSPKEFDFRTSHMPSQFHYTGPFHDGLGRANMDFPWDKLTGEPLIYASMGTLQNGLEPVFSTIAEAVGNCPGVQLVMSIGSVLDPSQIQSLPPNAIVLNQVPQIEILKRAALCITHAGFNTTVESLTQGVPMVAIPVTNDQPGVAARIVYTKTGVFVPVQELTAPRLKALIDEVLSNPEYRQNAQKMKRAIAATNGLEKAIDLLEEAFHLPRGLKQMELEAVTKG